MQSKKVAHVLFNAIRTFQFELSTNRSMLRKKIRRVQQPQRQARSSIKLEKNILPQFRSRYNLNNITYFTLVSHTNPPMGPNFPQNNNRPVRAQPFASEFIKIIKCFLVKCRGQYATIHVHIGGQSQKSQMSADNEKEWAVNVRFTRIIAEHGPQN